MLKFSDRFTDSGKAFGFYDSVLALADAVDRIGLNNIPGLENVSLSSVSGLNNTLVVNGSYSGGSIQVLVAQYATPFSVRAELSGSVTASLGNIASAELGSVSVNGIAFSITIAGESVTYSPGNQNALRVILEENQFSPNVIDNLFTALDGTIETIDRIESAILTTIRNVISVDHSGSASSVNYDLTSNTGTSSGNGTPVDIGDLTDVIGSGFDDTLTGGGEDNNFEGGGGSDSLVGGGGNDVLDGGGGSDNLAGGSGRDTYLASGGDVINDSDGSGKVYFNGLLLTGAKLPEEEEDDDCEDEDDEPNNGGDEEDKYIGSGGEEYIRSGSGLTVMLGGQSITIQGWSQGALGIKLGDDDKDPTEWTPPDCFASPLVFDLDGDGIELVRLNDSHAYFDIDADGDAERTAWVAADDGILAIDLNGNGTIDGAQELFGYGETYSGANGKASTVPGLEDGGLLVGAGGLDERFTSGFDALAAYDLNLDGVISSTDTFYNAFRMWRDLDGDGRSETGELFTLEEVGVAEISLDALAGRRDIEDSLITDTSSYVNAAGDTREVSDVWFRFSQFDTVYDKSAVTEEIRALPNITGTGGLPDLHIAMAEDSVLRQMVQDVVADDGTDLATFRDTVENVLMRWAKIEGIDAYGRGASANGQRIALIEILSDTEFGQWSGPNPRSAAGQILDLQYELILRDTMVKLAAAGGVGADVIPQIAYNSSAFIDLDSDTLSGDMLDQVFNTAPTAWNEKFAHIQAGVMMLDRVYMSFADVITAADEGAAYKTEVETLLATAGFENIGYDTLVGANIGSAGEDAMISPSVFGFQFFVATEVALTGGGDDELKWGNKQEILLWGEGQGNDEIDADVFFARATGDADNVVRMQELVRADVTIGRNDGPIGNDVVVTITATGETLTFRNLLLAKNSGTVALEFADGEEVLFGDLEEQFSTFAETGTANDDTLFQRTGDVLDGGAGDDILMGGRKATTYVFGRGYGNDEIMDDRGFGAANTVQFGPGITSDDLIFERPVNGDQYNLIITIADTGEQLTILNQFANTLFKVDTFLFESGFPLSAEDILFDQLENTEGDDRLVGSGREELFGLFNSMGNDTFVGLGGDDRYIFGADSGQDVVEDNGGGRYSPNRSVEFYRELFVENDSGDLVEIGFAFDELTASRSATRLTFLHEPSGAELVVDNTRGFVERYTFDGDDYVYTLPEVMDLIDGNITPEVGSEDDDLLTGDNDGNNIAGGLGNDTILGLGGPDTLAGDEGNDLLDAGDRGSTPSALQDDNTLSGGEGNDTLLGGWKEDILDGGDGDDRLEGDFGFDTYIGGAGDDLIISENGGGAIIWNHGDGNDMIMGTNDNLTLELGPGIAVADVTFAVERINIEGISDYYEFDDAEAWGLTATMLDGSVLKISGSPYSDNFSGLDEVYFTDADQFVEVDEILDDLYAPSDTDQIFVGTRSSDTFAPGGGYDQIFLESSGGFDTVSIGLAGGRNEIHRQLDRLAFETEVFSTEVTYERFGDLFEDLRVTLVDGTTVVLYDVIEAQQGYDGVTITQTSNLGEIRFGDGTVLTNDDVLANSFTVSAGDDVTTGDILANDMTQSAGNDTLRGSGGSDDYHFEIGTGQDVIVETSEGFDYYTDDFESTYYDLGQLREEDTLHFGAGLTLADLNLVRTGETLDDLRIEIVGESDSILISNQFRTQGNWGVNRRNDEQFTLEQWRAQDELYNWFNGLGEPGQPDRTWGDDPLFSAGIERFVFADGTELNRTEFAAAIGSSDNSGDNVISSGPVGTVLDGGAGNDELRGGTGDDMYRFDEGYDSDYAVDAGGTDTLEFGAGLNRGQLTLTRTGADQNDLLIEVGGEVRTALYVEGQFAGDEREIEVFTFADGTTLSADEIRDSLLARSISNGDDVTTGFEASDIINARRGDDRIEVRGGNDIVDGGTGFDSVVLRGPRADYVVEVEEGRIVVTDLTGRDGVNRLYNIERLVFADDPLDGGASTLIELVENVAPDAGAAAFSLNEDGRLAISAADLLPFASDPDGANVTLVSVGAVSGGSLAAQSDGSWLFTPEQDFNGALSFEYVVEDAGGLRDTGTASIQVGAINDAPAVDQQINRVTINEDTTLAFAIPADAFVDVDGDSLSRNMTLFNGAALPGWLSFDGSTLSGTPPQDWNGSVALRLTVSDGIETAQQFFDVVVRAVNDAPAAIGTLAPVEVVQGDVVVMTLMADALFVDVDGDAIALDVMQSDGTALPTWLSFDPSTGVLTGVAPAGVAAPISLVVTGSDGHLKAELPFEISISSGNAAPEILQLLPDVTRDEDGLVNFALPAGFVSDPDGDALSYTVTLTGGAALPVWLNFDPDGLVFNGQPPANFNGTLEISVAASDGELSVADTFALTLAPINDAPIVVTPLSDQTGAEDTAVNFTLPADTFADVDSDALSYSAVMSGSAPLPTWLAFDGSSFSGQPPANFNGSLDVKVIASDGLLEVEAGFTLEITPVNDAPSALDDGGFVVDGTTPLEIGAASLLANDSDIDGDTLGIVGVSGATGGSATLGTDGDITFLADAGFEGTAGFTYTVSDGALEAQAYVTVDVTTGNPYEGWLIGSEGRDYLYSNWSSESRIFGAGGNDRIYGGLKDDSLNGGDGNDRIYGLSGDDDIAGQNGNDRLYGHSGDDTISGGTGNDRIWGGSGQDTFVFRQGNGKDRLQDFDEGGWSFSWWHGGWYERAGDLVSLDVDGIDTFDDLLEVANTSSHSVTFDFGDGDSLILAGTRLSDLSADDFIFA